MSIKAVREHMSPEILEQYGSTHRIQTDQSANREGNHEEAVIESGTDRQEGSDQQQPTKETIPADKRQ